MRQVIRTIIAYYNGHEFIKEQVDSILNQVSIDNFDNQVYIYDDGSNEESLNYLIKLYEGNINVKIISDGKNFGPFVRYISTWFDAIKDGVDFIFFADQDDVFLPEKYFNHINFHIKSNKGLVMTSDFTWNYQSMQFKKNFRKPSGHNMSFMTKNIILTKQFSIDEVAQLAKKYDIVKYQYHDSLLAILFINRSDYFAKWDMCTSWHRVHINSLTNSNVVSGVKWRIRADGYNYYFLGVKPIILQMFDEKISINMFNKKMFVGDKNATDNQAIAGWIKWKLDNLAMRIRCKWMRNFVATSTQWMKTSKSDRIESKKKYKKYISQLKAK